MEAASRALALAALHHQQDTSSPGSIVPAAGSVTAWSAIATLHPAARSALELAVFEGLRVNAIAERMQLASTDVLGLLDDALRTLRLHRPSSTQVALSEWRHAQRDLESISNDDSARRRQTLVVAHRWLDYQVASGAVLTDEIMLITDADRRYVATTANAPRAFDHPSLVGLRVDDINVSNVRPVVPDVWNAFVANGSMTGEYDCDRPGQSSGSRQRWN